LKQACRKSWPRGPIFPNPSAARCSPKSARQERPDVVLPCHFTHNLAL
jgi:hypothetical protein